MTDEKVTDLIPDIMRVLQQQFGELNRKVDRLGDDMRAGFASIRSHQEAQQRDINNIERRLDRLEDETRLIKRAIEFPPNGELDA